MSRLIDLTGKTFWRITVVGRGPSKGKHSRWECKCSCGNPNTFLVDGYSLTHGGTQSCGCYQKERASEASFVDITGKVFGRLTVESFAGHTPTGNMWNCVCSCPEHNRVKVLTKHLNQGLVRSCGCLQKESRHLRAHDLTGKRFGRLVVIKPTDKRVNSNVVWLCRCDCEPNKFTEVAQYKLESGETKSCGCLTKESARARRKYSTDEELKLSACYDNMISRCYNPNVDSYKFYGNRGIYVCSEWLNDRSAFVKWGLTSGYRQGLTIERIDNNGPYAPWNCRWATAEEQCSNRRSSVLITVGNITDTVTSWARKLGCHHTSLKNLYDKDPNAAISKIARELNIPYADTSTIARLVVPRPSMC